MRRLLTIDLTTDDPVTFAQRASLAHFADKYALKLRFPSEADLAAWRADTEGISTPKAAAIRPNRPMLLARSSFPCTHSDGSEIDCSGKAPIIAAAMPARHMTRPLTISAPLLFASYRVTASRNSYEVNERLARLTSIGTGASVPAHTLERSGSDPD
jgi:hypothetical protein